MFNKKNSKIENEFKKSNVNKNKCCAECEKDSKCDLGHKTKNEPKIKCENKRKISVVNYIAFLLCALLLFGCTKNTDSFLNSKYFNTPSGNLIETQAQENSNQLLAGQVVKAVVALECKVGGLVSLGSGVCVSASGLIVTNEHVVSKASEIVVYGYNNVKASAVVLWSDEVQDVAILKSDKAFDYLQLQDQGSVQLGEEVLAVGTPLSLNFLHTCTGGIVSAINRTLLVSATGGTGYMQDLIQHDASINSGNSGGPLINASGKVIGINTLKISTAEGLGFAIPSAPILSLIKNFETSNSFKTPFLGVYGYNNSLNYAVSSEHAGGFFVQQVSDNSPAANLLASGDVIVSANENVVQNATDLRAVIYSLRAGQTLTLEVKRGDKTFVSHIKTIASPAHPESVGALA